MKTLLRINRSLATSFAFTKAAVSLFIVPLSFSLLIFINCQTPEVPRFNCESPPLKPLNWQVFQALNKGDSINLKGVIQGEIIANDRSGQFYKSIVIQPEKGEGMTIEIDDYQLSAPFPLGQTIFISLDSVYIKNSEGLKMCLPTGHNQLDFFSLQLTYGCQLNRAIPQPIDISQLSDHLNQRLVTINRVQFQNEQLGKPFFNSSYGAYQSLIMIDDLGRKIAVQISRYSDFANDTIPSKSGTITGILKAKNGKYTVIPRNREDIALFSDRQSLSLSIEELRTLPKQVWDSIPINITGVVSLSGALKNGLRTNNLKPNELIVQDQSAAIFVAFPESHDLTFGDRISIRAEQHRLSQYSNRLVWKLKAPIVNLMEQNVAFSPQEVSMNDLIQNKYPAQLVKLKQIQLDATLNSLKGYHYLSDCLDSILLYTQHSTVNALISPPRLRGEMVGVGLKGDYPEFWSLPIEKEKFIGPRCDPISTLLNEDFESEPIKSNVKLRHWLNYAEQGAVIWSIDQYRQNRFATISAYQSGQSVSSWLITPVIKSEATRFRVGLSSAQHHVYDDKNNLSIYLLDENGHKKLPIKVANVQSKWYEFNRSFTIIEQTKPFQIGIKYEGTDLKKDQNGTFMIDDIFINPL